MAVTVAHLDYAMLTDPGRRRLANEDAVHCEPWMRLFVVSDGIGGSPAGEAASQIVVHAFGHVLRRHLRGLMQLDPPTLRSRMLAATEQLSNEMYAQSRDLPGLSGMGATIVAMLIDGKSAYVVTVGDSRCYLLHAGQLRPLTHDHARRYTPADESDLVAPLYDPNERRRLMQYMGIDGGLKPSIMRRGLVPGDRLLLCTDGLTDAVPPDDIHRVLADEESPAEAAQKLIDAANAAGGPDNITVAVVHYHGQHSVSADQVRQPASDKPVRQGVAPAFFQTLQALDAHMTQLIDGARPLAGGLDCSDLLREYRDAVHAGADTSAIAGLDGSLSEYHHGTARPGSPWRVEHERLLTEIQPVLCDITGGSVWLCPMMTRDDTSQIFDRLWRNWRGIERRYLALCEAENHDANAQVVLCLLADQMRAGIQTMMGLLQFLARFMREE